MILFLVAITIRIVFSDDNTNIIQISKTDMLEEKLKREFGCTPTDEYKLIDQSSKSGFVENVCLPSSYQVMKPPDISINTPVGVVIHAKRFLEINERRRSITLVIELLLFWEDTRIKIHGSGLNRNVTLPRIRTSHPYIWVPLLYPDIMNIREINSVYGDGISVGLGKGKDTNQALSTDLFSPNATVMYAFPMWKVKLFCPFEFSKYPFDQQTCSFMIAAFNLNITICEQQAWGYLREKQLDFGGYDLNRTQFKEGPWYESIVEANVEVFGFHIKMTRQIETYFYQYYLPCMAVVITSIFSFIVPLTAIPGRVMIVVTQFLTLTNLFSNAMVGRNDSINPKFINRNSQIRLFL